MSAACVANVRQLALRIDFPDTAPDVSEMHIALLIHDDAGAGMSRRRESRQGELRRNNQNGKKVSFHTASLTWHEAGPVTTS